MLLRCTLAACLVLSVGCASRQPGGVLAVDSVELSDTAFFPQNTNQCGPAALTTVLQASGVAADFDSVAERIFVPDRGGSLQLELLGATRAHARMPVRVPEHVAAIVAQLEAGRPVLVMQNLGVALLPIWHYSVVVGYLSATDQLVLRSGAKKRHLMSRRQFARTWSRADNWALVVLRAGDTPVALDPEDYLLEASALELLGRFDLSSQAYRSAMALWPDSGLAVLGYANSLLGLGELEAARAAYRALLELEPGNLAARNNLAQTLAEMGCAGQALAVIAGLPPAASAGALYPVLLDTVREIRSGAVKARAAFAGDPICSRLH